MLDGECVPSSGLALAGHTRQLASFHSLPVTHQRSKAPTDRRPAIQTILPLPAPVHHLGLFREPTTLEPVEYYNNLPYHRPAVDTPSDALNSQASELAILLDPVIATGGTSAAAIQTLKEWGVKKVIVMAVLGAVEGLKRAASEWPEGTEIWVAGVDGLLTEKGMIKPGLGDVGDRLFLTIGK